MGNVSADLWVSTLHLPFIFASLGAINLYFALLTNYHISSKFFSLHCTIISPASVRFWPEIMLQEQLLQEQLLPEHE